MAKKKRKTSTNRYEHLARAQIQLDFHQEGPITSQEVKKKTIRFLEQAKKKGHKKARIITGKGIHSKGTPLVKPQVKRTLIELESQGVIHAFYPESARHGGEGAFVVDL